MGNSLHEQLKKAGLVTDRQLQQAHKAKQKKEKLQRKSRKKGKVEDQAEAEARRAAAADAERDRELNHQRVERERQKAIAAQIRQLIESNRVAKAEGEITYSFTDGKKVARMFVSETVRKQLSQGRIAIVRLGQRYELVPAAVAEKIRQRDPSSVVLCNDLPAAADEDDLYADYQVPDDLVW